MASGKKRKKGKGGGGRPVATPTEQAATELASVIERLEAADDPSAPGPLWGEAHRALLKGKADAEQSASAIANRDVDRLRRLLAQLRGEAVEEPEEATADVVPDGPEVPAETLRLAMRAFRKRLKLTRLDHESRLGVGPMSGGKASDIDAIVPPHEHPTEVWDALVRAGELRAMGKGFYALAEETGRERARLG